MATKYNSPRLFKNDFLERLTHVHPIVPLVFWTPVIVFLMWRTFAVHGIPAITVGLIGFAALIWWTFTEYFLHRVVFHYEPTTERGRQLIRMSHGVHHEDPQDPTRLVAPPLGAVILATIFYVIYRAVLGPVYADPFMGFFLIGYLCYDYTHFATHHFKPRTRVGKFVKQYHMLHHYVTPNARFGVSNPLWDYVFGTVTENAGKSQRTA